MFEVDTFFILKNITFVKWDTGSQYPSQCALSGFFLYDFSFKIDLLD